MAGPTWLLEHQHVLGRSVHGQRAGPLHGAVRAARHAVAAPGVGKPEVLVRDAKGKSISADTLGVGGGEQNPEPEFRRQIPWGEFFTTFWKSAYGPTTHLLIYREGI